MKTPSLAPFYRQLLTPPGPNVFNPWTDRDAGTDTPDNGPEARLQRLKAHLATDVKFILVGEAPGYQGCHVTGVPFTSERLIVAGQIPRVGSDGRRLSTRHIPWSEPSATTVWGTLYELGIEHDTMLWNAYPWHPHKPDALQSNRTPTPKERVLGVPVLKALLAALPGARVFAVGKTAEASLGEMGLVVPSWRHPSMGGATAFRSQLKAAIG